MADGTTKPIREIHRGDRVWAHDPESGESGPRKVVGVWPHQDRLVEFTVVGGSVVTTEDHEFWNETDEAWQHTQDFDVGDQLLTAEGALVEVGALDWDTAHYGAAFDLTIEEIHTYFVSVGSEHVLVHNCGRDAIDAGFGEDFARALDEIDSGQPRHTVGLPDRYKNDGSDNSEILQSVDPAGRLIAYTRHYVNPKEPGKPKDANRIVTGSDGSVYVTVNHYASFTQIR